MKRDVVLTKPITSSFLSCEKDAEIILKKLFVESRPYSDILKRLMVIQSPDCLDNLQNQEYINAVNQASVAKMIEDGYIILQPRVDMQEHEEVKSYLILSFNDFTPNKTNPEFRDCTVNFDIVCHTKQWDLGNFRQRPLKIVGYIDGLLNNSKLTGIGTLQFLKCDELIINHDLAGYTLSYWAVHGSDDQIPYEE